MPIFARKCAECGKKFKTRYEEITLCPEHLLPPPYRMKGSRRSPFDISMLAPHIPQEYAQVANRHKPFRAEYLFPPSVPPSSVMPQKDPPPKDPPPKDLPPYPIHRHGKPEKGSNKASEKAEETRKKAYKFKMLWLEELENFDLSTLPSNKAADTSKLQDSSRPSCTRETGELETEKPNLKTETPDLETQNAVLETSSRETETPTDETKREFCETKQPSDETKRPVSETTSPVDETHEVPIQNCEVVELTEDDGDGGSESGSARKPTIKIDAVRKCLFCGKEFTLRWGKPRRYCSDGCKEKAKEARLIEVEERAARKAVRDARRDSIPYRSTKFARKLIGDAEQRKRDEMDAEKIFRALRSPPPSCLPTVRYCKQCGSQFMPHSDFDDSEFCSADCYARYAKAIEDKREEAERIAEHDRKWREAQKMRNCPICHQWFMPDPKERRKQIYCSHNCAVKASYRKKHPEADPLRRASDFDMVRRVCALPPAERWQYAKDFTPAERQYMLKLAKESGYFDSRTSNPLDLL